MARLIAPTDGRAKAETKAGAVCKVSLDHIAAPQVTNCYAADGPSEGRLASRESVEREQPVARIIVFQLCPERSIERMAAFRVMSSGRPV